MEHDGLREVFAAVKALSSDEEAAARQELAEKSALSVADEIRLSLALGQLRDIAAKLNGAC